jgi:hypothetical protein
MGEGEPTRALAMLALRRFSRVDTPTSECSTSWTRCCVCVSCDVVRCSGEVGAAASIGEASAPSSAGADVPLKSGSKVSVVSIGAMGGAAAVVGIVVVGMSASANVVGGLGCSSAGKQFPAAAQHGHQLHHRSTSCVALQLEKIMCIDSCS